MSDGETISRRPNFQYRKDRVISAPESKEAEEVMEETILPAMVAELARRNKGLAGKIKTMQDVVTKTAREAIPVHPDAVEVRQALRILYPDRDLNFVYYDQYLNSLKYEFARASADPINLSGLLTGNTEIDSRLINREVWKASDDMDPVELAIVLGQFLLAQLANRIMQPYSSQNTQQQVSTKIIPPSSEQASAQSQMLIGLAALLLQMLENVQSVKDVISETIGKYEAFAGMSVDEIVKRAEEEVPDDAVQRHQKGQRPYWEDVIKRYCDDFVRETLETGYEGWALYPALEDAWIDTVELDREFEFYGGNIKAATSTRTPMSNDMYDYYLDRLRLANEWVDKASRVLNHRYTQKAICCLIMILGRIPTKHLYLFRAGLELSAQGISFDMSASLNSMAMNGNSFIEQKVIEPIMNRIDRFIKQYSDESLEAMDPGNWAKDPTGQLSDSQVAELVLKCTPFNELMDLVVDSWARLGEMLKRLLRRAWRRIKAKSVKGGLSLELMAESKSAKVLLRMLNEVINAIERGNLCAQDDNRVPTPEELGDLLEGFRQSAPQTFPFVTGGDPYETFNPVTFTTPLGFEIDDRDLPVEDALAGTGDFQMADCIRRYQNLDEVLTAFRIQESIGRDLRDASYFDDTGFDTEATGP
jgi:hypothetical protein